MCCRFLGFVLLIWFHGALKVQSQEEPCNAPTLVGGYFVPAEVTYTHGSDLTYACDNGRKPAVEGWWATSTCQNGKWSPEPQCIDETSCLPPNIPNAKYTENPHGWYEETEKIRITCDKGYVSKNHQATAECQNGTWTSVPVCERSRYACDEPPQIPHAVVIHQEYQDLFPEESNVTYECEDGYDVEDGESTEKLLCIAGNWTMSHPCKQKSPVTDKTNSEGGTRPGVGHGGDTSGGRGSGHTGGGHSTSAGRETRPAGGGVPTGSGSDSSENRPVFSRIDRCGAKPNLTNGDVVTTGTRSLTYQCNEYYRLEGPAEVVCYGDGSWSQLPRCRATYCAVDTAEYPTLVPLPLVKYVKEGKKETFNCLEKDFFRRPYLASIWCYNGKTYFKSCCSRYNWENNWC